MRVQDYALVCRIMQEYYKGTKYRDSKWRVEYILPLKNVFDSRIKLFLATVGPN